jgi:hypothetical protein
MIIVTQCGMRHSILKIYSRQFIVALPERKIDTLRNKVYPSVRLKALNSTSQHSRAET